MSRRDAAPFPFSNIPQAIQVQIAASFRSLARRELTPLLAAGRCGRDAILGGLTRISLMGPKPGTDADVSNCSTGPLAGLLHRACTQAPVGLRVHLHSAARLSLDLSELIQPGIASGGWDRVHHLGCSGVLPAQLGAAFPSLHTLDIYNADIADGSLFLSPNAWRALSSLDCSDLRVQQGAVPAIAAALASLPNLKDLTLGEGAPAGFAAQMTGLTSLCMSINSREQGVKDVMATATRNPGLQLLSVDDFTSEPEDIAAPVLQHLLQSCTTLTSLCLPNRIIDQQGLDILLQYGPCITTLAVSSFDLSASRSDREGSWESLELEMGPMCGSFLKQLAYLPLGGVHTISMPEHAESPESLDHLHVPLPAFKTKEQRELLRAAAENLAASKAWQDCPATSVTLLASSGDNSCLGEVLCALAPLGGEHITALTITGTDDEEGGRSYMIEVNINKAEVEALAASFGSAITSIYLDHCRLSLDFWPALARCFPAVTRLSLGYWTFGAQCIHLAMWGREMGHPVTIVLRNSSPGLCMCDIMYESWAGERRCNCMDKVLEVLHSFGVQVTLKTVGEDDSCDQPSESE